MVLFVNSKLCRKCINDNIFNSVKGERVVMGYSDLEVVYTPLIGCDRQDFSQNNRVFYIPKTVGFGVRL